MKHKKSQYTVITRENLIKNKKNKLKISHNWQYHLMQFLVIKFSHHLHL